MNNRTKRLYIVALLLWVILLTMIVVVAHSRTGPPGAERQQPGALPQPRVETPSAQPGPGASGTSAPTRAR